MSVRSLILPLLALLWLWPATAYGQSPALDDGREARTCFQIHQTAVPGQGRGVNHGAGSVRFAVTRRRARTGVVDLAS